MKPPRALTFALLFSAFFWAGCSMPTSGEISPSGTWKDGEYTETVDGKNGKITVRVTIDGGVLAAVGVDSRSETPERGGVAIAAMPSRMIEEQTFDVDGVTGASIRSASAGRGKSTSGGLDRERIVSARPQAADAPGRCHNRTHVPCRAGKVPRVFGEMPRL